MRLGPRLRVLVLARHGGVTAALQGVQVEGLALSSYQQQSAILGSWTGVDTNLPAVATTSLGLAGTATQGGARPDNPTP